MLSFESHGTCVVTGIYSPAFCRHNLSHPWRARGAVIAEQSDEAVVDVIGCCTSWRNLNAPVRQVVRVEYVYPDDNSQTRDKWERFLPINALPSCVVSTGEGSTCYYVVHVHIYDCIYECTAILFND